MVDYEHYETRDFVLFAIIFSLCRRWSDPEVA